MIKINIELSEKLFRDLQEYKVVEEIDTIENTIIKILKENQAKHNILDYLEPMISILTNLKPGTAFTVLDLLPKKDCNYQLFFLQEIENMFTLYLDSIDEKENYYFLFFCQKTLLNTFIKY